MQVISLVLADVSDWRGLANWLNIKTIDIETKCALNGDQASCYRQELVRRYCNSRLSGNPCTVAKDISKALEKMNHNYQGEQLRNLEFGKSVAEHSSPVGRDGRSPIESSTTDHCYEKTRWF